MNHLKFPFKGHELIEKEISQAGQDLFVLGILDGKVNGTYLEIGAGPAVFCNNTYMLEAYYNWKGASVEYDSNWYAEHKRLPRRHHIELTDARIVDYVALLNRAGITETDIDYVSLDCDPPHVSFEVLQRLPFDTHRFSVITFEHDTYAWGDDVKKKSRKFMESKGYELVVSNISPSEDLGDFEDWYVHPELVSREQIDRFKSTDDSIKLWSRYLIEVV